MSGSRTASATDTTDTTDTVLATVAAVLAACLIVIRFSLFLHLHLVRRDLTPVLPAGLQEAMRWAVRVSFYVFYVFFAALILPKLRRRWPGLAERVFLVVTPLWFLVVAVALGVA